MERRTEIWRRLPKNAVTNCHQISLDLYKGEKRLIWYARRESCIRKGGCCARDCHCCKESLLEGWIILRNRGRGRVVGDTTQFFKVLGHCTAECACCVAENGVYEPHPHLPKPRFVL
ncbi:hypothetical protein BJX62DRAFT_215749 [Aspergillus germanicus]